MEIHSYSYIKPRITIKENINEICISFSSQKDITNLLESNRKQKISASKLDNTEIHFSSLDELINFANSLNIEGIKSKSSIYRAKSTIYDLINSNYWDYFVTITMSPEKLKELDIDIKDIKSVQSALCAFIKQLNRRIDTNIKYVLIPEYQDNGNVHFHGVVSGLDKNDLEIALNEGKYRKDENGNYMLDDEGNYIPNEYYLTPLIRKGNQVYHYKPIHDKFGYTDFEEIRHKNRVGSYCTKYINKELENRINEFGAHLYVCSKGLERSQIVNKYEVENIVMPNDEMINKYFKEAFVKRNEYNTKIVISKIKGNKLEMVNEFMKEFNVIDTEYEVNHNEMIYKLIALYSEGKISRYELNNSGIDYDIRTGEIKKFNNTGLMFEKIINNEGEIEVISRQLPTFKEVKNKDNVKYRQLEIKEVLY